MQHATHYAPRQNATQGDVTEADRVEAQGVMREHKRRFTTAEIATLFGIPEAYVLSAYSRYKTYNGKDSCPAAVIRVIVGREFK